ncbi:hypothetical protein [Roseivivax lentus]|uniref:hypothetical protein n=1 Tax=Roseivivax lentus TaxID=633194 RepID=UPI00190EDB35|nr:hypothetical protein [Roseivivax lentus]
MSPIAAFGTLHRSAGKERECPVLTYSVEKLRSADELPFVQDLPHVCLIFFSRRLPGREGALSAFGSAS